MISKLLLIALVASVTACDDSHVSDSHVSKTSTKEIDSSRDRYEINYRKIELNVGGKPLSCVHVQGVPNSDKSGLSCNWELWNKGATK